MGILDHRARVVASVAGSTAAQDFPDLPSVLAKLLTASAGRAKAAGDRSRDRSELLRGAIRKAAEALPLDAPDKELEVVVGRRLRAHPGEYGLAQSPSLEVLRDELRILIDLHRFSTETDHS